MITTIIYLSVSIGISTWMKHKQNKIKPVYRNKVNRRLTDHWHESK